MSETTKPIRPPGLAPEVMTLREAALYLGCGLTLARRLRRDGELVATESLGRVALVTRASVERRLSRMLGETSPSPARRRTARGAQRASVDDAFGAALRRSGT